MAAPAYGADSGSAPLVRYAGGRLSVQLTQVPLDQVMAAVARETGTVVQGELLDLRAVSKRFEDVPLDRALRRLLGRQNFILWYDADGRPIRIELLGLPEPPPTKKRPAKPPPTLTTVIGREAPVPLPPSLQSVLGKPRIGLFPLLAAALRQPDAAVRRQARRIVLDAFEQRASLREALKRTTPDQLAGLLRRWPPANVDELLREMSMRTRDPGVRGLALQTMFALRPLRAAPPAVAGAAVPRPGG